MIGWVFVGFVVFLVLIEVYSLLWLPKNLRFHYDVDMDLSEPGEVVTMRLRLRNIGLFPIFLAGLSVQFDDSVKIEEDETWCRRHLESSFSDQSVRFNLSLPARGLFKTRVRFSFKDRGYHVLGRVYLETGDFLGLKSAVVSFDPEIKITCTAAYLEDESVSRDLGGILGDVSVRRFVFDDPTLVVGYREYSGREPMKMISWRQSAKMGRLMVKVNDFTTDSDIAVLVNMEDTKPKYKERGLMMARCVCEELENRKIPYAFKSNGDLFEAGKGMGKAHLRSILKLIGTARPACYYSFSDLVDDCISYRGFKRSYVVVTPHLDDEGEAALSRLQRYSDLDICVLYEDDEEEEV